MQFPGPSGGAVGAEAVYPLTFSSRDPTAGPGAAAAGYLADPATRAVVEFFEAKGAAALKEEDRREAWYADWVEYQARHRLYATLLTPAAYSSAGGRFDLRRLTRLVEAFAYFSPAHAYSLQVTFLGFFSILMGTNEALKREAVAALASGGLFALAVSEREHGADLLGNEFALREVAGSPGRFVAEGSKYYIGNANVAAMVSVLARRERRGRANGDGDGNGRGAARARRAPPVLFVLRPSSSPAYRNVRKIRTVGVRSAFVGAFDVRGHELPASDLVAHGRDAWDAVAGTVTLGKFFLGFGSIGICEHAQAEAAAHLAGRVLYARPVTEMPHIRAAMSRAYVRLTAMKLYAYRALDYVQAASADERRYLLFAAVQKAKIGLQGVAVMTLLSECVGAKGFEADTFFEMALRDAPLIPRLEGSTHINLAQAARFVAAYFDRRGGAARPAAVASFAGASVENAYLMTARTGPVRDVAFARPLDAYRPLRDVPNVRQFARQVRAFALFVRKGGHGRRDGADLRMSLALGQCLATVAYGQLVAEHARRARLPAPMVGAIFYLLIGDLTADALAVAELPNLGAAGRALIRDVIAVPRAGPADWDWVAERMRRR
jgi:acyl-CoA dehydrogenase